MWKKKHGISHINWKRIFKKWKFVSILKHRYIQLRDKKRKGYGQDTHRVEPTAYARTGRLKHLIFKRKQIITATR